MSNFFLLRHGNTDAVDYLPGRTEGVFLNNEGKQQAEDAAKKLDGIKIDKIITSPVDRTKQTALHISSRFNIPLEIDDYFIELDFGEWTGKSFSELDKDQRWHKFNTFRSETGIPGGESMIEAQQRLIKGIELLERQYPDKNIIIVSHGDPIKLILCYYLGIPIDFIFRFMVDHCAFSILELSEYGPLVKAVNTKCL
jgi:broad specificity phosphatase PhoE